MITKEQQHRLRIFLVVASILTLITLLIFAIPWFHSRGYLYTINFQGISVSGLENGATIKYQGVRVGSVTGLAVNPDDLRSVLVTVRINRKFNMKTDMRAKLMFTGITGLKFIEINGGTCGSPNLSPGGFIQVQPGLGEKAEDIVQNIDQAVKRINEFLTPRNQKNFEEIVQRMNETVTVWSEVFQFRRVNLEQLLIQLDGASAGLQKTTEELQRFAENLNRSLPAGRIQRLADSLEETMNRLSRRLSDKELGRVIEDADSGIRRISDSFLELKVEISRTLEEIRDVFNNLSGFTRRLNEDPNILLRKDKRRRSNQ